MKEKKRYEQLNDAAYSALKYRDCAANFFFKYTFTVHSHYDSTELFAEAFWRFYTDNETLAANCPKLYALMSRVCPAPDN